MRQLPVLVLFLATSFFGIAQAQLTGLKPEITGAWFNVDQDGHGFNVQALDEDTLLVFWYTYGPDGVSTFLLGVVSDDGAGRYVGTLQRTDGMVFGEFDPETVNREDWGTLTVEFDSCFNGTVSWTSTVDGFPDGSIPIQRLTSTYLFTCVDDPVAGNYAFTFYDEDRSDGNALFLPDGRLFFAGGETGLEFVGSGTWRRSGARNVIIDGTSYEVDLSGDPPLDSEAVSASAVLNVNGMGDLDQIALGSIQFRATYLRDFRRNVGPGALEGSYSIFDEAVGGTPRGEIEVARDGSVTGTLGDGCAIGSGAMLITVPGANQFSLDLVVDDPDPDCAGLDFSGAGFVIDPDDLVNPGDLFTILVSEDIGYASVFRLNRND
jgi:hypothetical protein